MVVYVIIPVYNVEKYLKRCLDSIFSQTFKNYIAICVNDGSTDSSLVILNQYKSIYKEKMVLIDKINGGLPSARNAGLNYIETLGECSFDSYITFIDSDDYVCCDYLKTLVTLAKENNCDLLCSSYYGIQEDGGGLYKRNTPIDEQLDTYTALIKLFSDEIQSHSWSILYRATLWKGFRFDETKIFMEDQPITFQLFLKAKKIVTTEYAGYYYVHRIGSLCQSHMSNKKIISALMGYIFNYQFNFNNYSFSASQISQIRENVLQQYSLIYLMMYPRFNYKIANEEEINSFETIVTFTKKTKAIRKYRPNIKKNIIKKFLYLYLRPLYKLVYKFFRKKYD